MSARESIVGWLDSAAFDLHDTGPGHPERSERLAAVREGIAKSGLEGRLVRSEPLRVERALLESIHSKDHVARVEALCRRGGGRVDADTSCVEESWEAALLAAGAVAFAVDRVMSGEWQRAFCSVRPPGHHATPTQPMGFCLFNNVAVGAQAAIQSGRAERVAIFDWDVHHGNGTQDIFWRRGDVLYASTHQYPFYPGTGAASETGAGEGKSTTVNCPLRSGDGDAEILEAWHERIRPAFDDFAPDLVLISAGFDADARDPLATLRVSAAGFEALSRAVIDWADAGCGGRVVSVLEGGYDLDAIAEDVAVHVGTFVG